MTKAKAPHEIVICGSCLETENQQGSGIEGLNDRLATIFGQSFQLVSGPCMNGCDDPVTMAFQGENKATYLFAGIDIARDLGDILAFAGLYHDCPDGWIEDARKAGRLRHCLVGRIPAMGLD